MKFILAILFGNLTSITCVIFAGLLALDNCDGWGWFLVVSLLHIKNTTTDNKPKKEESK